MDGEQGKQSSVPRKAGCGREWALWQGNERQTEEEQRQTTMATRLGLWRAQRFELSFRRLW